MKRHAPEEVEDDGGPLFTSSPDLCGWCGVALTGWNGVAPPIRFDGP